MAAENAALSESSLRVATFRLNAFDVKLADGRRAMSAGFFLRSFSAFFSGCLTSFPRKLIRSPNELWWPWRSSSERSDSFSPAVEGVWGGGRRMNQMRREGRTKY